MSRPKTESISGKSVFVVFNDDKPISVCSTEANAKKFVPKINREAFRIQEYCLDYGLQNDRPGLKFYLIYFNPYGQVSEAYVLPASHWSDEFWITFGNDLEIRIWAESKKAAIERAREKRKWLFDKKSGDPEYWEDRR